MLRVSLFKLAIIAFLITQSQHSPHAVILDDCLVPCNEILSGGPPKDGIPALTNPEKVSAVDGDLIWFDEEIVLGVYRNGIACAYPLSIFFWHEIVNDEFGGDHSVITYCPLTGTGMHFDGETEFGLSTFGVSGKLWNNNLILYNRAGEETYWSQIFKQAIAGPHKGQTLTQLPVIETTWKTWKALYPDTLVMTNVTGFARDYTRYPYGDYESLHVEPLFSMESKYVDRRFPPKLRVIGLVGEDATKVYTFDQLEILPVVNDRFEDSPILVVYHGPSRMAVAYDRTIDGQTLRFRKSDADSGRQPFFLEDEQTGSLWTVTGTAIEGPMAGSQLTQRPDGLIAFWFAWGAFYSDPIVFDGEATEPTTITNWQSHVEQSERIDE